MNSTSSLFAQNRDEVMTPILPAEVNGPTQAVSANVSAFSRAVNNDVKPQEFSMTPVSMTASNNNDGERLTGDVIQAGNNLRAGGEISGMGVKQSDATYLTNQIGNTLGEVSSGLFDVLNKEHAGNEMGGPSDELEAKPVPVPQPVMNMPSPTSGMSSGPGM